MKRLLCKQNWYILPFLILVLINTLNQIFDRILNDFWSGFLTGQTLVYSLIIITIYLRKLYLHNSGAQIDCE